MNNDQAKAAVSEQSGDKSTETEGHAAEPSGYKGNNPATAGPGPTAVSSTTPENR